MAHLDRSAAMPRYTVEGYREDYPPAHTGYRSPPETRIAPARYREAAWDTADAHRAGPPDYRLRRQPMTPQPQHSMYAHAPPRPDREREIYRAAPPSGRTLPPPRARGFPDAYDRRTPAPGHPYREQEYYDEYARRPLPPPASRYAPYPDRRPAPPPHRPMPHDDDRRVIMTRQPPMYEAATRMSTAATLPQPIVVRAAPVAQTKSAVHAVSNNDKKKRRIQLQCYIMYRPTRCLWDDCPAVLDCWSKLEKHVWHAHLATSGADAPLPGCKWEGCHYHADTVQEVYKHALVPHMKAFSARCPFNCLFEGSDFQALMDHIDRRHATSGPDDFVPGLIHHRPKLDAIRLPSLPVGSSEPGRVTLWGPSVARSAGTTSSQKKRMVARKCFTDHHPRKEDFVKKVVAGAAISACLSARRESRTQADIQIAMEEAIIATKQAKSAECIPDQYPSDTDDTATSDAEGSNYERRDWDLESEEGGPVARGKLKRGGSPGLETEGKRRKDSPVVDPEIVVKKEIEEN